MPPKRRRRDRLWERIRDLSDELQPLILSRVAPLQLRALRGAFRNARALVDACIGTLRIPASAVQRLERQPLRLHARFPRLQRLQVVDAGQEELGDSAFAELATSELCPHTSLTCLSLSGCESLGSAALLAIQTCCPLLRHLDLYGTGAPPKRPFNSLSQLRPL
jgi:hypothetical protein